MTDEAPRHNPEAITPLSLEYPTLRLGFVRYHAAVSHEFEDPAVVHIPVDLDGVVP